jgi:hypothetical protein
LLKPGFMNLLNLSTSKVVPSHSRISDVDVIANVEIGGDAVAIYGEVKGNGRPMTVRNALEQLRSNLFQQRPTVSRRYGVFLAPFVSPESARICEQSGIGYVDLAGNAHLEFGNVYIDIRTADNPFKEKRDNRPLFSSKGERVLSLLLTPPLRGWKVTELSLASNVSLGQVSTVRKHLLESEWAIADGNGLRLTRPDELARAWRTVYKQRLLSSKRGYTVLHGAAIDAALRAAMEEAGHGGQLALGSFSAARWIAPFARQGTTYLYATEAGLAIAERHLDMQSATRGENVVIWIPKEDDVLTKRIEPAQGVWCTGLVQTWLDLSVSGERGIEAAEHLAQQELAPVWRSAVA